jgi:hypothetical protein
MARFMLKQNARNRQSGIGLLEFLLGVAISVVVVVAIARFFIQSNKITLGQQATIKSRSLGNLVLTKFGATFQTKRKGPMIAENVEREDYDPLYCEDHRQAEPTHEKDCYSYALEECLGQAKDCRLTRVWRGWPMAGIDNEEEIRFLTTCQDHALAGPYRASCRGSCPSGKMPVVKIFTVKNGNNVQKVWPKAKDKTVIGMELCVDREEGEPAIIGVKLASYFRKGKKISRVDQVLNLAEFTTVNPMIEYWP